MMQRHEELFHKQWHSIIYNNRLEYQLKHPNNWFKVCLCMGVCFTPCYHSKVAHCLCFDWWLKSAIQAYPVSRAVSWVCLSVREAGCSAKGTKMLKWRSISEPTSSCGLSVLISPYCHGICWDKKKKWEHKGKQQASVNSLDLQRDWSSISSS